MHRRPQFEPLARLAAAGCGLFRPCDLRWAGLFSRTQLFRPLVSRGCGYSAECCCGGSAAGALLRLAVPLGLGLVLGLRLTLVRLYNRVQLRRLCRRALLGWLCHWIDTWCNEVGLCYTSVRCGGE